MVYVSLSPSSGFAVLLRYGTSDFAEARVLPAWSILESSPLFKDWDWSPLIHSTLEDNGIPPPSNSPSALVRKSLPPMHPWAWKAPQVGTPDDASDRLQNSRGAYLCAHTVHFVELMLSPPSDQCIPVCSTQSSRRACTKGRLWSILQAPSRRQCLLEFLERPWPIFARSHYTPERTIFGGIHNRRLVPQRVLSQAPRLDPRPTVLGHIP